MEVPDVAAMLLSRSRLDDPVAEEFASSTRREVPCAVLLDGLSAELIDTPLTDARTARFDVPVAVT